MDFGLLFAGRGTARRRRGCVSVVAGIGGAGGRVFRGRIGCARGVGGGRSRNAVAGGL